MSQPRFLSRGIDYLGDLGAKLKDLQGFATLAHELIQNADDAPGVTSMSFDIRPEELFVENNGSFSDCQEMEMVECPWKIELEKLHRCDFHRFRHVAGGDKRDQLGTTGAFGIGFISVYQITDQPELISNDRHWILHEDRSEQERIEVCPGCARCTGDSQPKTRFILPWCSDPASKLRLALRAEATSPETPAKLLAELEESLPAAMLFLKNLKCIELKQNGMLHRRFERVDEGNSLILTDGDSKRDRVWHLLHGDFEGEAQRLRQLHPGRIEEKRSGKVTLAIPQSELQAGLLCACLPSQHETGLPFHINADFFPTNDRKRIIFESDYQSAWNRAALKAAAATLAGAIGEMPKLLEHQAIWNLFARLQQVADEAGKGHREKALAEFWTTLAPKLKDAPCVFTTQQQWKRPGEAYILSQKEEVPVIGILEELGVAIVHEDLRPHFNLLRSSIVGLQLFGLANLTAALTRSGLTGRTEKANWPKCLQPKGALETLWREAIILARREDRADTLGPNSSQLLATAVIAPGRDGALWPCRSVYQADDQTRELFQKIDPSIPFLGPFPEDYAPISTISPMFNAAVAIQRFNQLGDAGIKKARDEKRLDLTSLFPWLEARKPEILANPKLKAEIAKLPIFPSSGTLRPLVGLSLPGNFTDPLDLAALVDLTALGGRREFLRDLGADELSFQNYASNHLPPALSQDSLPIEKKRQAVLLLAGRLGEILDDNATRRKLVQIPIVECQDGFFRSPVGVYFQNAIVIEVLSKGIPFATVPKDHEAAVREFYKWLGVTDSPRFEDIVSRVKQLVQQPPNTATLLAVKNIFAHLGERMRQEVPKEAMLPLQKLAWLPARGQQDSWHRPDALYAAFQDYLFESQASFLDIPRDVQIASTEFLKFLGVNTTPTSAQVVDHLLHNATAGKPVNQEVYRFLNDHADAPAIRSLKDKPCLLLPDNTYVEPAEVFWGEHPFGRFRKRLGLELRRFSELFAKLGIREMPDHADALKVLHEISTAFGAANTILDEEAHAVLMHCWRSLETALEVGSLAAGQMLALKAVKCVPNPSRALSPPEWMFFEDRAGIAAKFDGFLKANVIPRPLGAWKAMTAAGVQPLGSAVEVHLIECVHPTEDAEVSTRVRERKTELGRVLEAQAAHDKPAERLDQLLRIRFESVKLLKIQYTLKAFGRVLESKPESSPALFQREHDLLTFIRQGSQPSWPSIARELALALFPDEEPGRLAPGIKEVLAAGSEAEAKAVLDELGFATLEATPPATVAQGATVDALGGSAPPAAGAPAPGQAPTDTTPGTDTPVTPADAVAQLLGGTVPPPAPPPGGLDTPDRPPGQPGTGSGDGSDGSRRDGQGGTGGGATGSGGRKPSGGSQNRRKRGKLRSYVIKGDQQVDGEPDSGAAEKRTALDEVGVAKVVKFEEAAAPKRYPDVKPPKYPGYDIESKDEAGNVLRYIEVKSVSGDWGSDGVGLTKTQFEKAREIGDRYWLYVVERADKPNTQIHCIQDPARRVDQFLFDDGWRDAANGEDSE